jgi:hypothetical protein
MLPPDLVAKLSECAKSNFVGARDVWFSRQSIFSWAVIVGLILEGPELAYDMLSIVRSNIRRFRYSIILLENRVELAKVAAFIGWIFIIVGLLGELRAGSRIADLSAIIQGCSDAEVKEATLETGDAAASAKTAREEAHAVEEKADALDLRLNRASRKLTGMEEQVRIQGPRWKLLEDNRAAFVKALSPFAGQRITVVECGAWGKVEIEAFRLTQETIDALGDRGAGWSTTLLSWVECGTGGGTASGGNLIVFSEDGDKTVKDAAQALSGILNKIEISTVIYPTGPRWNLGAIIGTDAPWALAAKDPTTVVLLVGTNPMFDVAGWKKRKK